MNGSVVLRRNGRLVLVGTDLMAIQLRSTILGNSASFRTFVRDSGGSVHWQRVDPGEATRLVASQTFTVLALEGTDVLIDFRIARPILSPNGDGVNDDLEVAFSVARVSADREVRLAIFDLSGRRVREVVERRGELRGQYAMIWDGRDEAGTVVAPGIYLARVEVETDSGSANRTSLQRPVYVAY